jgi:DNA transformation protein
MTALRTLPDHVAHLLDLLRAWPGVQAKAMFGGHGLYQDGLMFGIVIEERLYLKVDAETVEAFTARGLGPFTYETKGGKRSSLRYHLAPHEALDDPAEMVVWARRAHEVALRAHAAAARKVGVNQKPKARGRADGRTTPVAKLRSKGAGAEPMSTLGDLPNLGPASQAMLAAAGIHTLDELQRVGAVQAYALVKQAEGKASLNLLWALEGALSGKPWQQVAEEDRASLLMALEDVQRHMG